LLGEAGGGNAAKILRLRLGSAKEEKDIYRQRAKKTLWVVTKKKKLQSSREATAGGNKNKESGGQRISLRWETQAYSTAVMGKTEKDRNFEVRVGLENERKKGSLMKVMKKIPCKGGGCDTLQGIKQPMKRGERGEFPEITCDDFWKDLYHL